MIGILDGNPDPAVNGKQPVGEESIQLASFHTQLVFQNTEKRADLVFVIIFVSELKDLQMTGSQFGSGSACHLKDKRLGEIIHKPLIQSAAPG
jgi:hypothetical protein